MEGVIKQIASKYLALIVLLVLSMAIISSCTLSGIDRESTGEITEADLQAAIQVLSESTADENSGFISGLNDALTPISQTGFVRSKRKSERPVPQTQDNDEKTGRGQESNITYTYDASSGRHTISFDRIIHLGNFFKNETDTLTYIFRDFDNAFIASPAENKNQIKSILFNDFREGSIQAGAKNSVYTRDDSLFINKTGIHSEMTVNGVHRGAGSIAEEMADSSTSRQSYKLNIYVLNITVKQEAYPGQGVEERIVGDLDWDMTISRRQKLKHYKTAGGDDTVQKDIEGTMELVGDRTALVRVKGSDTLFKINLDDGSIQNQQKSFDGIIDSINPAQNMFTMTDGRTIYLTEATKTKFPEDINNLGQLGSLLQNNESVAASGTGSASGGIFTANSAIFKKLSAANPKLYFNAYIADIDLQNRTLTLRDQRVISVAESTYVDPSGDYQSLSMAWEVLSAGQSVIVHGFGNKSTQSGINIEAVQLRFNSAK